MLVPFGAVAAIAVAVLAVTGPLLAGQQIATPRAGLTTPYGAVLLVKLALVAAAGVAAALVVVRRTGRGRLAGEAALLTAVAIAAAVLSVTPPARGPGLDPVAAAAPTQRTVRSADLLIVLAVRPGTPGPNVVTVDVYDTRRPAPAPVTGVALDVAGAPVRGAFTGERRWQTTAQLPGSARVPIRLAVQRPGVAESAVALDWAISAPAAGGGAGGAGGAALAPVGRTVSVAAAVLALLIGAATGVLKLRRRAARGAGAGRSAQPAGESGTGLDPRGELPEPARAGSSP